MNAVTNNQNKKKFILEDEVFGMAAEDKNVLINAEQNKKKIYLPDEIWDIVKSYVLRPKLFYAYLDLKLKRAWSIVFSQRINNYGYEGRYCDRLKKYVDDICVKTSFGVEDVDIYTNLLDNKKAYKARSELALLVGRGNDEANAYVKELRQEMLSAEMPSEDSMRAYFDSKQDFILEKYNKWDMFFASAKRNLRKELLEHAREGHFNFK